MCVGVSFSNSQFFTMSAAEIDPVDCNRSPGSSRRSRHPAWLRWKSSQYRWYCCGFRLPTRAPHPALCDPDFGYGSPFAQSLLEGRLCREMYVLTPSVLTNHAFIAVSQGGRNETQCFRSALQFLTRHAVHSLSTSHDNDDTCLSLSARIRTRPGIQHAARDGGRERSGVSHSV